MSEYFNALRKNGKISLTVREMERMDFDTKINRLHNEFSFFKPAQYSKMMAVKWDRNIFGHSSVGVSQATSDAEAIIHLGISAIKLLEKRLSKHLLGPQQEQ